ncbi:DHA2 family efflux MFS transporter permease subunit [Kitasatospora sp. NPDC096077]|uniref:DHA2 family efflux MFS transporter permease subunit n=1 Tax=Kitasatospora sp. NPDC096077 TaxID=3155544 RepID=UPI0033323A52
MLKHRPRSSAAPSGGIATATAPAGAAVKPAPTTRHRGLAMFVLIFASFMDLLDTTVVNVALPSMQRDLGATSTQLEWVVGGYTLAFAVVLITGGRLGDIFGRQRLFLTGVAGFTAASLASALATSGEVLVGARVVQGAFAALMVPQVLASVQALFKPKERAAVLGAIGAVSGLATVLGPLLGGWLISVDAFGWHWRSIFAINIPIGTALMTAAWLFVPNTRSTRPLKLDWPGLLLASLGMILLVYPLVEGRALGWPAWIWAMLSACPLVLGVFAVNQKRRAARDGSPLMPMSLFTHRGFNAGSLTQFFFSASLAGFFLVLTLYLQLGLHFDAIGSGLALLPFSIGALLGSGVSVPLAPKAGKPMVVIGGLLQAGGILWARQVIDQQGAHLSGWDLLGPMALAGIGLGLLVVPLVDLAVATIDPRDAGAASGTYSTFQQVGGALGVAVAGVVFFGKAGTHFDPATMKTALLAAATVPAVGFALSAVTGLLLPPSSSVRHHTDDAEVPAVA